MIGITAADVFLIRINLYSQAMMFLSIPIFVLHDSQITWDLIIYYSGVINPWSVATMSDPLAVLSSSVFILKSWSTCILNSELWLLVGVCARTNSGHGPVDVICRATSKPRSWVYHVSSCIHSVPTWSTRSVHEWWFPPSQSTFCTWGFLQYSQSRLSNVCW